MSSRQFLDHVQSLASLAAVEAEPHGYAERVRAELTAAGSREALAARDEELRQALARIDAVAERVTRIRLEYGLADEPAIGSPTRKVFASTVISYESKLELLEARARDAASRGGAADPARAARTVADAARAALALRSALRGGVLALVSELARESLVLADREARDRRLDESARRAWSALRRELEAVATQPERILGAAFATRLASWPAQIDEPDPAAEPTFADVIELD